MLTTDGFIKKLNSTGIYAVKTDMYGVELYETREDYENSRTGLESFMSVGTLDTDWGDAIKYGRFPDDLDDDVCSQIAKIITEYLQTPIPCRSKWPNGTQREAMRHMLNHFVNCDDYSQEFLRGALTMAKGIFAILDMKGDYKATVFPSEVQLKAVNE